GTSGGKAMLACLSEEELHRRLPGQRLEGTGRRSIRTWPALVAELKRVRRRGWAANLGEGDPSIGAVGAAVRSGTGEPRAAVVVAAPLSRLSTGSELAALAVVEAAARVPLRGGFRSLGPTIGNDAA